MANYNLHFLNFNNYYNRQVKLPNEQYLDVFEDYIIDSSLNKSNFDPRDGIQTSIEARIAPKKTYNPLGVVIKEEVIVPNYVIVCHTDRPNDIVSRWFVIEADFKGSEIYTMTLVRDIIAENYTSVIKSPCYIEKGWVPNTDPAVFNSEGVLVNQIKQNETKLYDNTGIPWIVGYWDAAATNQSFDDSFYIQPDFSVENYSNLPFYNYLSGTGSLPTNAPIYYDAYRDYHVIMKASASAYASTSVWNLYPTVAESSAYERSNYQPTSSIGLRGLAFINEQLKFDNVWAADGEILCEKVRRASNYFQSDFGWFTQAQYRELQNLNGKIVYITNEDKYFTININFAKSEDVDFTVGTNTSTAEIFSNLFNDTTYFTGTIDGSANTLQVSARLAQYTYTLSEVSDATYAATIPNEHRKLIDAPYDMFFMPYGKFTGIGEGGKTVVCDEFDSFAIANIIARKFANNEVKFCYDLQLLPYCPFAESEFFTKDNNGVWDLTKLEEGKDFNFVNNSAVDPTDIKGIMFWATKSNFTFNINHTIEVDDYKIANECDIWRLCSPNYNGVFEFNAAKNGGVQFFNVDCSYKPYNPYIHMNPNFSNLYGADYNDARGLICGGDFSLSIVNDLWQSYQLQNKNYEKTFQRQIENMEVQHDVAKIQERVNIVSGTAQGAASGAMMGGMTGNPYLAAIGGLVGGASSLAGGIADISLNERLRNEALNYAQDMFNYNLDNIKALPTSLAKVSALNFNNKIVPFLEYYSCSNEEKEAIRNKIKYNGMTIMRVGTIEKFTKEGEETYVKAKLIRWEYGDDFHFINFLSSELNKGVFITK